MNHLDPRIEIVRALASEFSAPMVPLDRLFAQAAQKREATFWVPDGIHPSQPGHALIAEAWLKAVGATA